MNDRKEALFWMNEFCTKGHKVGIRATIKQDVTLRAGQKIMAWRNESRDKPGSYYYMVVVDDYNAPQKNPAHGDDGGADESSGEDVPF